MSNASFPPSSAPSSVPATTLEVAIATDAGREPSKQINEDSAFARETRHGYLAVVCDGMGGHVGGREASQQAVATIFRVFDETPSGTAPNNVLAHAIREANTVIHARGRTELELAGMGSTCVAVLVHAGGVDVAHVGDSRVYMMSQGQVYQVTKDHSLVQRLVDANMLTPEEAAHHPNANQITNALGMRPDVDVELRAQPLQPQPGDVFLLCSDGLSDDCGPQDMLAILAPHPTCDFVAQRLVDLANARGGHDNITVIVLRFPGGKPLMVAPTAATNITTPVTAHAVVASPTETMEMVAPPVAALVAAPAAIPSTPASTRTATPIEPAESRRGNVGLWIGVALVLVATIAIALGVAMMRRSSASEEAPNARAPDDGSDEAKPLKKKPIAAVAREDAAPVVVGDEPVDAPTQPTPKRDARPIASAIDAPSATASAPSTAGLDPRDVVKEGTARVGLPSALPSAVPAGLPSSVPLVTAPIPSAPPPMFTK